jgi:hypothetical protein
MERKSVQMKKIINGKEIDFNPCMDLSNYNLSGADLTGLDLSYCLFISNNLKNTNLTRTRLFGAQLISIDLEGANLSKADLSFTVIRYCKITTQQIESVQVYTVLLGQVGHIVVYPQDKISRVYQHTPYDQPNILLLTLDYAVPWDNSSELDRFLKMKAFF